MKKLDLLYEGKAKKVYTTDDPDVLIVDYKDDATAFNGQKKGTIQGKGVINNRMTNRVFQLLEKEGIPIQSQSMLSRSMRFIRLTLQTQASSLLTSRLSSAVIKDRLFWQMRLHRIPAASGISIPTRSWTRIVSAGIWEMWKKPTTRYSIAWDCKQRPAASEIQTDSGSSALRRCRNRSGIRRLLPRVAGRKRKIS